MPLVDLYKSLTGKGATATSAPEPVKEKKALPYAEFDSDFNKLFEIVQGGKLVSNSIRKVPAKLRQFTLAAFEQKNNIKTLLGLGDDLRVRLEVEAPGTLTRTNSVQLDALYRALHRAYERCERSDNKYNKLYLLLVDNNLQNFLQKGSVQYKTQEVKFSKFITNTLSQEEYEDWLNANMSRADQLRPNERVLNNLLAGLVEAVKGGKRPLIISANPMDLIISSEKCGYTSCHGLHGAHMNGNMTYCQDPYTFIVFTVDPARAPEYPFYKVTRMFSYLDPKTNKSFIVGRAYGNMSDQLISDISTIISGRLAVSQSIANDWAYQPTFYYPVDKLSNIGHRENSHDKYPGFFDLQINRFVYHSSVKPAGATLAQLLPTLSFPNMKCPGCNKDCKNGTGLLCPTCDRNGVSWTYRCHTCNEGTDVKDEFVLYNKVHYCQKCYERNFFDCNDCNEHKPTNERSQVRLPGQKAAICTACAKAYARCAIAGSWHKKEEVRVLYTQNLKPIDVGPDTKHINTYFETLEEAKTFYEQRKAQELAVAKDARDRYTASLLKLQDAVKLHEVTTEIDANKRTAWKNFINEVKQKDAAEKAERDEISF